MSLNITSEITTRDGFVLPISYGRISVTDNYDGEQIACGVNIYKDEAAFEAGDAAVKSSLRDNLLAPYNRDVDGVDILDLAHDAIIDQLSDQGIASTKVL